MRLHSSDYQTSPDTRACISGLRGPSHTFMDAGMVGRHMQECGAQHANPDHYDADDAVSDNVQPDNPSPNVRQRRLLVHERSQNCRT